MDAETVIDFLVALAGGLPDRYAAAILGALVLIASLLTTANALVRLLRAVDVALDERVDWLWTERWAKQLERWSKAVDSVSPVKPLLSPRKKVRK